MLEFRDDALAHGRDDAFVVVAPHMALGLVEAEMPTEPHVAICFQQRREASPAQPTHSPISHILWQAVVAGGELLTHMVAGTWQ